MRMLERSDKKLEEREHVWLTVDIKDLPSTILVSLAAYIKDPEALDVLADSSDISTKLHVANNPHTSSKTLKRLAKEKDIPFIKETIALHENTDQETLEILSVDEDEHVRIAAASNPHTPVYALILRLFDSSKDVVIAAIRNPMTPKENVVMLSDSENEAIAFEVKKRLK